MSFGVSHYDVYQYIDDKRHHVGMGYRIDALPGDTWDAFNAHVERRAQTFVESGLADKLTTTILEEDGRLIGRIELRFDPTPAPLETKRKRGKRAGRKAATT